MKKVQSKEVEFKKLGMGERDPKTGVQMARLGEGKTFQEFMYECYVLEKI